MVLALYPQPSLFDDDIALIRESTPVTVSSFYLRRPYFVPWSADESVFILETDEPQERHEFIVNRTDRFAFVPGESPYTVSLQLQKGANRIDISTPNQSTYITVAATAVESWFTALGREYYLAAGQRLKDIQDHFLTPWTTRVSAHLVPYNDIFLPARMPKIQQTRLAIMTSMGQRLGHGDGVRQVATAVSYSTPPVTKAYNAEFVMPGKYPEYPYVTTFPTTGEVRGRVLDLWTPNNCLAAHQALFQLVLAMGGEDVPDPKPLSLVAKDDSQIILRYNGGSAEAHVLNPASPECTDIEFNTSCDAGVRAFAQMESRIDIMMLSPQLPFDETVENPINFGFFDEGFWFDASTGHPDPGLGGGDDAFDTVDPDDPFGEGFVGFSLSRRFDQPGCLDSRIQVGQRLSKFTAPIISTTPPALTPEPPLVEGNLLTIDAELGAPSPTVGNTVVWATSNRLYMYEGDHIRFENPDLETTVVSAWPVLDSVDQIVKSDATATFAFSGTEKVITAPAGFFTFLHQGFGIQVDGADLFSIVKVSDDGVNSYATIAGNPATPAAGPFIINVYEPLRDRADDSEPDDSVLQGRAGRPTYEILLADPLLANLSTGDQFSYRVAPRVSGAVGGGSAYLSVMSDVKPLPGDLLYFDSSTAVSIISAIASGTHHTTGFPIYDIELDGVTPGALVDNEPLFVVRADPCWLNGDPVTPLMLISLAPAAYLTV